MQEKEYRKVFTDKEGKKIKVILPCGKPYISLVEPSKWFLENKLKRMQETSKSMRLKHEREVRIARRRIKMGEKELAQIFHSPIPAPYKMAFTFAPSLANIRAYMEAIAEGCFNIVQLYDNYYRGTVEYRDTMSTEAVKFGLQLCPFPGFDGGTYDFRKIMDERVDDPGIWGWQVEEPYMTGWSIQEAKNLYAYSHAKNDSWKVYITHADDEWCNHGWVDSGLCDVITTNIYPMTQADPKAYHTNKITLLCYRTGTRTMIDTYGCEHLPLIMAWAYEQWNQWGDGSMGGIEGQYTNWTDLIDRGPTAGCAYMDCNGFFPEQGGNEDLWNEIVALNVAMGGYCP